MPDDTTPAPDLYQWAIGSTFELDTPRMARQLRAVLRIMLTAATDTPARWLTLEELRQVLEHRGMRASTASVSARLRDLRKPGVLAEQDEHRPLDVKRRRRSGDRGQELGVFEYLVIPPGMPGYAPPPTMSEADRALLKADARALRKAVERAGRDDELTVPTAQLANVLQAVRA